MFKITQSIKFTLLAIFAFSAFVSCKNEETKAEPVKQEAKNPSAKTAKQNTPGIYMITNGNSKKFPNKNITQVASAAGKTYGLKSVKNQPDKFSLFELKGNNWSPAGGQFSNIYSGSDAVYGLKDTKQNKSVLIKIINGKQTAIPSKDILKVDCNRKGDVHVLKQGAKGNKIQKLNGNKLVGLAGAGFKDLMSSSNTLYAVKNNGALVSWDGKKWNSAGVNNVKKCAVNAKNKLVTIKDTDKAKGKAFELNDGKWQALAGKNYKDIAVDNSGKIYVINEKGVVLMLGADKPKSIGVNKVSKFVADSSGIIYAL